MARRKRNPITLRRSRLFRRIKTLAKKGSNGRVISQLKSVLSNTYIKNNTPTVIEANLSAAERAIDLLNYGADNPYEIASVSDDLFRRNWNNASAGRTSTISQDEQKLFYASTIDVWDVSAKQAGIQGKNELETRTLLWRERDNMIINYFREMEIERALREGDTPLEINTLEDAFYYFLASNDTIQDKLASGDEIIYAEMVGLLVRYYER